MRTVRSRAGAFATTAERAGVSLYSRKQVTPAMLTGIAMASYVVGAHAALTPTQYRAKAAVICRRSHAERLHLQYPVNRSRLVHYLQGTLRIGDTGFAALARLKPPRNMLAGHMRALRYDAELRSLYRRTLVNVERGSDPKKELQRDRPLSLRLGGLEDAEWRKLGIKACTG